MSLDVLIERQRAALAAGYTADPSNGRREFWTDRLRRYVPAEHEPADAVYFCPGCRSTWERGIQDWYAGWWSWRAGGDARLGRDVLLRTMRDHEANFGPKHRMRIVEDPEGVPVADGAAS